MFTKVKTPLLSFFYHFFRIYCGGYGYYCGKMAEETPSMNPDEGKTKPKESSRKLQRRERAEIVEDRARRRRQLAEKLVRMEKTIDSLEKEEKELVEKMSRHESGTDYASVNRRMQEIDSEIPAAMKEWEATSKMMEELPRASAGQIYAPLP